MPISVNKIKFLKKKTLDKPIEPIYGPVEPIHGQLPPLKDPPVVRIMEEEGSLLATPLEDPCGEGRHCRIRVREGATGGSMWGGATTVGSTCRGVAATRSIWGGAPTTGSTLLTVLKYQI